MKMTSFLFYYKKDSRDSQVYSMVRTVEHSFTFDNTIGGYAYEMRANHSIPRSSWPGVDYPYIEKGFGVLNLTYIQSIFKIVITVYFCVFLYMYAKCEGIYGLFVCGKG
jgi:hypothetical protein